MWGHRSVSPAPCKTWGEFYFRKLTKSKHHENEIMLKWQRNEYEDVSSMINVWTKYSEPRLYGNWITLPVITQKH